MWNIAPNRLARLKAKIILFWHHEHYKMNFIWFANADLFNINITLKVVMLNAWGQGKDTLKRQASPKSVPFSPTSRLKRKLHFLLVARCSLLFACCPLLFARCLLVSARCLIIFARCLLLFGHCSLRFVRCLLLFACALDTFCLSLVTCYLLLVTFCSFLVTSCSLLIACC